MSNPAVVPDDSLQAPAVSAVAPPTPPPTSVTTPPPVMPTLAPPEKPSLWKQVLAGALQGLAGSAGSTSFGGGIARGAAGELAAQEQAKQAAAQQQQALTQDQMNQVKLATAKIDLLQAHRQFSLLPDDKQEQMLNERMTQNDALIKAGGLQPTGPTSEDYATAMDAMSKLHQSDPSRFYTVEPVRGQDDKGSSTVNWQPMGHPNSPIQSDVTITNADGTPQVIKAGTMTGVQVGQLTAQSAAARVKGLAAQNQAAQNLKNAQAKAAVENANSNAIKATTAAHKADDTPVVANMPDGSNAVITRGEADEKGLFHYKADPAKLNGTIAGFNDVQVKINRFVGVDFDKVQTGAAAALIGKDASLGVAGISMPLDRFNALLNKENIGAVNQATRDFVVAYLGAHEAITQLPRLQTFGQSNRMTQQQMEAAQAQLPKPGDDAALAKQKLSAVQDILDPLRKQVPRMPGAALIPSYREGK